jgi:hypothetical protein
MRLHEAIEKAGPGGKIRLPIWPEDAYWTVPETEWSPMIYPNGTAMCPANLKDDRWQVVEDKPSIEVGDEVGDCGLTGIVKYIDPEGYAFIHIDRPDHSHFKHEPTHRTHINRLTLIRKGPKVHRFEKVEIITTEGFTLTVNADHKQMHPNGYWQLKDNGKIYDMTLTERPSK